MRHGALIIAFLLPLSPTALRAADRVLTWSDCVQIASEHNPDLMSARHAAEASRATVRLRENALLPNATVSASYNRGSGEEPSGRWDAGFRTNLDLFNYTDYSNIAAARANARSTDASYRLTSSNVRFALRQAFANLILAQEQRTVSQQIVELRQSDAALVNFSYQSGRESKGNAMRAQAELLQAQAALDEAERSETAAQHELTHQLGEDEWSVVRATETAPATERLERTPDLSPFVESHPTVAVREAAVDAAKAVLSGARAAVLPTASIGYAKSVSGGSFFPSDSHGWSASAVVTFPLFSGGPTAAFNAMTSARLEREAADEDLRSARNAVRSTLYSAWSRYAASLDDLRVQTAFLEAARQRNGEADARYTNGLMTYEDWELIVTDRVNFERSVLQAEQERKVAEAQWFQAQGRPLEEK